MISPNDPDAGEFGRLLDDIFAVQQRRAAAAPVHRSIERHGFASGGLAKALGMQADTTRATTAAELTRTVAGIERLAADTAKLQQQGVGERRARIRQQVQDVLDRAVAGVAKGTMTAVDVARVEAGALRILAALDHQQVPPPVRVRVAA